MKSHNHVELGLAARKTKPRMRTKASSVAGGMAAIFAKNTLGVTVAKNRATTASVQTQHAPTTKTYRFNWPTAGASVAAKTHHRFRQKWSATASRYARPTAASGASTGTNARINPKSTNATSPPTPQNRNSLFAPDDDNHMADSEAGVRPYLNDQ